MTAINIQCPGMHVKYLLVMLIRTYICYMLDVCSSLGNKIQNKHIEMLF